MATVINPFVAVDGNGHVRANAKLYFYQTGTTTLQNTYSEASLSAVNANPVVADSNGLFPAIYLGDPPTFETYKAILKDSADVTVWTADPIAGAPITAPLSATMLRGYLAGLQRTANTTTTLTLSDGVCVDDARTAVLSLSAGTINFATVGADGLDAGALANSTSYHVFAIGKADGSTARLASASASSPTMPLGYTLKRRLGGFRTNGSAQVINYIQDGDDFFWSAPIITDVAASNPGATAVLRALTVPGGVSVYAHIQVALLQNDNSTNAAYFSDPDTADTPPAVSTGLYSFLDTAPFATTAGNVNLAVAASRLTVRTDTSARIRTRLAGSNVNTGLVINTLGWRDRRGRDD
jgi:hypothetical protein